MKKESRLRAEWKCVKSTITNHLSPGTTLQLSIESWDRLPTPEAWRKIRIRALDHLSESMHNTYQLSIFRAKRKSSNNIIHNRSKRSHHRHIKWSKYLQYRQQFQKKEMLRQMLKNRIARGSVLQTKQTPTPTNKMGFKATRKWWKICLLRRTQSLSLSRQSLLIKDKISLRLLTMATSGSRMKMRRRNQASCWSSQRSQSKTMKAKRYSMIHRLLPRVASARLAKSQGFKSPVPATVRAPKVTALDPEQKQRAKAASPKFSVIIIIILLPIKHKIQIQYVITAFKTVRKRPPEALRSERKTEQGSK